MDEDDRIYLKRSLWLMAWAIVAALISKSGDIFLGNPVFNGFLVEYPYRIFLMFLPIAFSKIILLAIAYVLDVRKKLIPILLNEFLLITGSLLGFFIWLCLIQLWYIPIATFVLFAGRWILQIINHFSKR